MLKKGMSFYIKMSLLLIIGVAIFCVCYFLKPSFAIHIKTMDDKLNIIEKKDIELSYDDRYDITNDYSEYEVVNISHESVLSSVVKKGKVSDETDENVVKLNNNSQTEVYACGTGTASIYLAKKSDSATLKAFFERKEDKNIKKVKAIKLNVTVKPAKFSIFYITGQSNAEGSCDDFNGYQPNDSVLCDKGKVYSTYFPRYENKTQNVTGIKNMDVIPMDKSGSGIAESLISNKSLDGKELKYKLDALTKYGKGKTGLDSGLGYEWNKKTGKKVWIVNCALAATSINSWIPGEQSYEVAKDVMQKTLDVAKEEEKAGHITIEDKFVLWMQGEADNTMEVKDYFDKFKSLHDGFKSIVNFKNMCIVSVRSSLDLVNQDDRELAMTSPRIVQLAASLSQKENELYDVCMVSNANQRWVSDEGVKEYFLEKYPSGVFSYPMRKNAVSKVIPTTIKQIHSDIHYSQIGHNENGISAADGLYNIQKGKHSKTNIKGAFLGSDGKPIDRLEVKCNSSAILVASIDDVAYSKKVSYQIMSTENGSKKINAEVAITDTNKMSKNVVTWKSMIGTVTTGDNEGSVYIIMKNIDDGETIASCCVNVSK